MDFMTLANRKDREPSEVRVKSLCQIENEAMFEQLQAYDNHVCADVSSVPSLVFVFVLGCIAGRLIKRVL